MLRTRAIRASAILEAKLKAWAPSMMSQRTSTETWLFQGRQHQLQNVQMCCGWVFKQNAQRFQKMDNFSSTALKE